MGRVFRGAAVRVLYAICIALLTVLVVIMYEGVIKLSGSWVFGGGIVVLIIEGLITNKMTQGFDWRWANPASALFSANCLAAIWFLQIRTLSYDSQGLQICSNHTAEEELRRIDLSVASNWLDFCSCGHCNGAAEQLFVIMLLVGRYFLPKGVHFYHPENDKINLFLKSIARTHFFLVIACNGADTLDMISYTRFPTVQGNGYITSMLLILFSVGVIQFCVDTLATAETKVSDFHIILETDLWSSLAILVTCDLPFLAMRLFLMTKYQVFSSMGVYFFFKNFVCMCVTLHKGVMIWVGKDDDEIEEYVATEPYSPEPAQSRMDTPDSLNDMSDSDSEFSHVQAVKSRAENRNPAGSSDAWGEDVEKLKNSRADLDKIMTWTNNLKDQKAVEASQFLGSDEWDVEAGPKEPPVSTSVALEKLEIWNPKADPAYFTEGYADECDAMLDMSRIGNKSHIEVPLGTTIISGPINFSLALPKPEPSRDIDSAKSERKSKKNKEDEADSWKDERKKSKSEKKITEDLEEDIDDILNTVDEDYSKEKKKKKKKDKEKDREKEREEEERVEKAAKAEKSEEKKHKKKKSKHEDLEPINEQEEDEDRREKHKKKKKSKDKDYDD